MLLMLLKYRSTTCCVPVVRPHRAILLTRELPVTYGVELHLNTFSLIKSKSPELVR